MYSSPEIVIKKNIDELNFKPTNSIDLWVENFGFVKIHLTENNKLVIFNNGVEVMLKDWNGAKDYKNVINEIEEMSQEED